jgi:hypothetical protein
VGGNAGGCFVPPEVGGGTVTSGNGGAATAYGGKAGPGKDNVAKDGTDGGNGGQATATAGMPGIATNGAFTGVRGSADAEGGNGGKGGDSKKTPGTGGDPGDGQADGQPANSSNGQPGQDGEQLVKKLKAQALGFVPDPGTPSPVTDGHFGTAVLFDPDTDEWLGTVGFSWDIPPLSSVAWDDDGGTVDPYLIIDNTGSSEGDPPVILSIDLSTVGLLVGEVLAMVGGEINIETAFSEMAQPIGYQQYRDNVTAEVVASAELLTNMTGEAIWQEFFTFPDEFLDVTFEILVMPYAMVKANAVAAKDP